MGKFHHGGAQSLRLSQRPLEPARAAAEAAEPEKLIVGVHSTGDAPQMLRWGSAASLRLSSKFIMGVRST